jgi:hypothetical protein
MGRRIRRPIVWVLWGKKPLAQLQLQTGLLDLPGR